MQKNQEIKPKRGVIAVKLVQACLLSVGQTVARYGLGQSRKTGDGVICARGASSSVHVLFVGDQRSRSDQAHVAAQNVIKLSDFVKTRLPQKVSDFRDELFGIRETGGRKGRRIVVHGTDFVADEGDTVSSDTYLLENNGAARGQSHRRRNDREGDCEQKSGRGCIKNIKQPFYGGVAVRGGIE